MYVVVTRSPKNDLQGVALIAIVVFNRLCCILNQLSALFQRETLVSAVDSVVALDDEWKILENSATYAYIQLAMMFIVLITEACQNIVHYFRFMPIFGACQMVATIHSLSLLMLQWTNLVRSLAKHMTYISLELTKLYPDYLDTVALTRPEQMAEKHGISVLIENTDFQDSQPHPQEKKKKKKAQEVDTATTIASLRRLHRSIHTVLQNLLAAYGVTLVIGFSVVIVNSVYSMFEIKSLFLSQKSFTPVWIFWYMMLTYHMVTPCQTLLDKTEECAYVLHGAMQNDIPISEKKQLLNFSTQLLDLPLTCSPCDFFQLDRRILFAVFGTIVTYVIILYQFDSIGQRADSKAIINATNC